MKKKKWIKPFAIGASLLAVTGAVAPLAVMLSSCSSTATVQDYSYQPETKVLSLNSTLLFPDENVFYGYQQIKFDTKAQFTNGKTPFNLITAINKALPDNKFFNAYSVPEYDKVNFPNGNTLTIPVVTSDATKNIPVNQIVIHFPKVKNVQYVQPILVQASKFFQGISMSEVSTYSAQQIIASLGQSIIPVGTVIDENDKQIINNSKNQELVYKIFIPNSGISYLILNFNPIIVPEVEPQFNIANLKIQNDWKKIINWSPELPSMISYKTIDNSTNSVNMLLKPVLATYNDAIHGENVINKFNQVYFGNGTTYNKHLNLDNLNLDVDYFLKTYTSSVVTSWAGQNILNSQVYTGSNLTVNDQNQINGNIVWQLQNLSGSTQTFTLPNNLASLTIQPKQTVSLVIGFHNSEVSPYLVQNKNANNQAYLTTAFSNLSINVMVNDITQYANNWVQPLNLFEYSYALKTLVNNVVAGTTYLQAAPILNNAMNNLTATNLNQIVADSLQVKLDKMNIFTRGVQGIATSWANNPTIADWLQSLSPYLYDILIVLTDNKPLSALISNIFSPRPVSNFIFFNWKNLVDLLNEIHVPGFEKQIESFSKLIQQIGESNKTLPEMEKWVKNVGALYSTLEKLFSTNESLAWVIPMLKHAMFTLQTNPSIIDFVFENLPVILQTFSKPEFGNKQVRDIFIAIGKWVTELIKYADKVNGTDSKPTPEPPTPPGEVSSQMGLNKVFMNIRTLDPALDANQSNYVSLFTYLSQAIPGKASQILKMIGSVFDAISYSGLSAASIKQLVDSFFNVEVGTQKTTLADMLTDNIIATVNKDNFTYNKGNKSVTLDQSWRLAFKQTVSWNFMPLVNFLNSIRIATDKIIGFNGKPLDLNNLVGPNGKKINLSPEVQSIIKVALKTINQGGLGNVLAPAKLVVSPFNSVNLTYTANNSQVYPYVNANGQVQYRYLVNKFMSVDSSHILKDSVGNNVFVLGDLWKNMIKVIMANISTSNNFNYSEWIYSQPIATTIKNFVSNGSLWNVTIEENSMKKKFKTYLEAMIKSNVTWTAKGPNGEKTMTYTQPKDLDHEINQYFKFGSAFHNSNYPFINYSTDLSSVLLTIRGTDVYLYKFSINFSVPTLYTNSWGICKLTNNLSWIIPVPTGKISFK
ncbi:hypothetical protein [Ureaplasma ceti]|uniref:Lipoprotein n=1 Tax=Ureaplasma ceti TaxID=3119530 RepID=A0ABP9U6E1_9BACT